MEKVDDDHNNHEDHVKEGSDFLGIYSNVPDFFRYQDAGSNATRRQKKVPGHLGSCNAVAIRDTTTSN